MVFVAEADAPAANVSDETVKSSIALFASSAYSAKYFALLSEPADKP
jgi:hypothetical protein